MSALSVVCCSLLSAVCAFTLVSASGCGTDAQGVDDCRDIEQARCSAGKNCGLVSDVAGCRRFYRDQCLHGLAVSAPGGVKVRACVAAIRAAGLCALQAQESEEPPEGCGSVEASCQVIIEPETSEDCAFLGAPADAGPGGSAGAGGSADEPAVEDSAGAAGK